jgi:hypothetical protein
MTDERVHEPTCRSCGVRMRQAPLPRSNYRPLLLNRQQIMWLENAARYFDAESTEPWSAADFVAWCKPDLSGKYPPIPPELIGKGSATTLPMVPPRLRKLVS